MKLLLPARLPLIDALKAGACVLIVLHHLAFYGPMSDRAMELAPSVISWLYDHARMAVQVFLVVAGFLAARGLAPTGKPASIQPLRLILQRHARLALPMCVAVLISILSAALARQFSSHESIPAAAGLWQFVSHALLLHGVLGQESLSAGVWYVAIDFQLFAGFTLCLWLAGRNARAAFLIVGGIALASLFHFNLNAGWDNWALYFAGAYALGVLAQWGARQRHALCWLATLGAVGALALVFEFRPRIALAVCTALFLGWSTYTGLLERWPDWRLTSWLARISYSVFLIHFPICLLANTLAGQIIPESPLLNLLGMGLAFVLSLAAGQLFFQRVEVPLGRLLKSISKTSPPLATAHAGQTADTGTSPAPALRRAA